MRLQVELAQIKQDFDRGLREKDEEFDNARRNTQRAIESMQVRIFNPNCVKNNDLSELTVNVYTSV